MPNLTSLLNSKRALLYCIAVIIFLIWLWWRLAESATSGLVQSKVKMFLNDGLQDMVMTAPRTHVNNAYYVPDVLDYLQNNNMSYAVYTRTLYDLNHDLSSPIMKVTSVSLLPNLDNLIVNADVEFPYWIGFTKSVIVQESIPMPHYKDPTGLQLEGRSP